MKTTEKYDDRDNFSKIIRQKLENYSLPVETGSWEELEKRLNVQPEKKRPLWPWLSGISVAASIALVITLYQINKSDHDTTNVSYHAERIEEDVLEEKNLSSDPLPSIETQPAQERNRQPVFVQKISALRQRDVILSEKTVQEEAPKTPEETPEMPVQEAIPVSEPEKQPAKPDSHRQSLYAQEPIDLRKPKSKNRSIAFYVSSGGRLQTVNNTLYAGANTSGLRSSSNILKNTFALSENILSSEDFNQIAHYPPVSVGLSLRKQLTNWLSVESGLTYSYLYCTLEAKVPSTVDASLTLHYLGIPVNLTVNLYPPRNRWNIYFSAGGMVEKGLLSHLHYVQNTYSGTSDAKKTISSNDRIQGLQWSVQAAIGFSYRFNRNYSLFLEPKMSYYFDNDQPFNVRTDYPFTPGVNAGLRHTW